MILFKRKKRALLGIDLAPFVDLVFTLLIFFVITAAFVKSAINMKLPILGTAQYGKTSSRVTVAIDRMEKLSVNGTTTSLQGLASAVRASPNKDKVLFQSDGSVRYELILKVMERLKGAGVKDIALQHDIAQQADK
jgi:biopolymer transport protein ExbD